MEVGRIKGKLEEGRNIGMMELWNKKRRLQDWKEGRLELWNKGRL
jgi:hypothetical protein